MKHTTTLDRDMKEAFYVINFFRVEKIKERERENKKKLMDDLTGNYY